MNFQPEIMPLNSAYSIMVVAYRFVTDKKGDNIVMGEDFAINFPANYKAHLVPTGWLSKPHTNAHILM